MGVSWFGEWLSESVRSIFPQPRGLFSLLLGQYVDFEAGMEQNWSISSKAQIPSTGFAVRNCGTIPYANTGVRWEGSGGKFTSTHPLISDAKNETCSARM